MTGRTLILLTAAFCAGSATSLLSADEGATATDAEQVRRVEFFESKIRPVLVEHCYKCHSGAADKAKGGLLLDSAVGVRAGGESGAAVVPGRPQDSLILSALRHETFEMPPDRRLPDQIVADFEKWIREGAVDPRTGGRTVRRRGIDMDQGRQFWSFQPVRRSAVPELKSDWPRTDIDRFILAAQQKHGLSPGPDARPNQVLRRLYFDLTGLPPDARDIANFEAAWKDDPDAAIALVADRLLASHHFGERWGRHWLDVVRFAESSGGGRSLMFPHAWRFRDYVIRSFNQDKPFDRLICEHLAGDLLPAESAQQRDEQTIGAGFLALGPTNYEQQDKELLRMEVVDEQIDTMGRAFLGMTLGCARCHDHKFDPIPTADYYALAGIFRSTKTLLPGNVSTYVTASLSTVPGAAEFEQWQQQHTELTSEIAKLKALLNKDNAEAPGAVPVTSLPGVVIDDPGAMLTGDWTASTSVSAYVGAGYIHHRGMHAGHRVRFETKLPTPGRYRVRIAYSASGNRCADVPVVIHHGNQSTTVVVDQRQRPPIDGIFRELGTFQFPDKRPAAVTIDCEDAGPGVVIVDAVQFLAETPDTTSDTQASAKEDVQLQALERRLRTLERQLKDLQKHKPEAPIAMAVTDESEPADWHIHIRGGIRNLGPIVPRGVLSVTAAVDKHGDVVQPKIPDGTSGRLQLAQWVASSKNPLTARVFVNRVWLHVIGTGIVRTPDNFGATGQPPTHPELLDYLAHTFVHEDNWSVKKLIRRIVVSRVYRLASGSNPQDPDNRLLTRGVRRRLEAEALRDAVLKISGRLDLQRHGGRTIRRVTQYDNGYDHSQSESLRSVYVPCFRNSMLEFFSVFDAANPNLVTGARTVSTLPSQSLYLLNSPFMLEQSEAAAQHFLTEFSREFASASSADQTESEQPTLNDMIDRAWLTVLGRTPYADESAAAADFLTNPENSPVEAWTAVFQALFASMDFRYID